MTTNKTAVYVQATDPLSQAGLATQLRWEPDVWLVENVSDAPETVGVVAVETVDEAALQVLRTLNRNGCKRIVLIVSDLDDNGLLSAIENGVCALVHRKDATPARLAKLAAKAAAGEGALPPDMLGRLLKQVSELQRNVLSPMGLTISGLTPREIDVLKLVASGMDTQEIADKLCFSERTIKNVLHDITSRFHLSNRTHAVAWAMREGLI